MRNPGSWLRHIVLFAFKEEVGQEAIEQLHTSFVELAALIPAVQHVEWGLNDSPENFHQGFTHCYLLTFASEEDRDKSYSPHPLHQAFVRNLQPLVEKVLVVDYWSNASPHSE